MKINGIIAEYNPFHNGHKYQLEESKRLTGADYTIAVISGNFVQRGTPALIDKHTRTQMALENGVDLVLELPAIYAVSSAEYFSMGAVSLLDKLNAVTHLCFGSECGNITFIKKIADILVQEPDNFSALLKTALRQGCSYPAARATALSRYLQASHCAEEISPEEDIFRAPNNVLGIEYLKALLRQNSSILPITIKRQGADYNNPLPVAEYCSALAIRNAVLNTGDLSHIQTYLPEKSLQLLRDGISQNKLLTGNDFSSVLYYKLLSEQEYGFEKYLDVSADLSNRIVNRLKEYKNFESFCDLLKTKELTYTRISRCLLHILLNLTKEDMAFCTSSGYTPYARILGFRKDASDLLSHLKRSSSIPLITKLADAEKLLNEDAVRMLRKDIQISQLYYGIVSVHTENKPANEFTIPVVIV